MTFVLPFAFDYKPFDFYYKGVERLGGSVPAGLKLEPVLFLETIEGCFLAYN